MSVIQVGLVDTTGELDATLVQTVAQALNIQVTRDLPQFWNVQATVVYLPDPTRVPAGVWPAMLVDSLPPGEGGFHLDKNNQPYAKIVASPDNDGWTIAASHEVVEMLVDPSGNRLQISRSIEIVDGNKIQDGPSEFQYLIEACDPCESEVYGYLIQGVALSDFLTPHFYDTVVTAGTRYSFTGALQGPRQILPGGYISWVDPADDEWRQLKWIDPNQNPEIEDLGPAVQGQNLRSWIDGLTSQTELRTTIRIARDPINNDLLTSGRKGRKKLEKIAQRRADQHFQPEPRFADGRVIPLRPPDRPRAPWATPPDYPQDLVVCDGEAPEPLLPEESDLGIAVRGVAGGGADVPAHGLVTIGDSLTMGYKSMAITDTDLSWPAMVADALGLAGAGFTYPRFPGPPDCPGLPLNLEALVRGLQAAEQGQPPVIKEIRGVHAMTAALSHVKSYWEHGPGSIPPGQADSYYHNLAVYGWNVADAYTRTVGQAVAALNAPSGGLAAFSLPVSHDDDRAMLITLRGPQAQQPNNPTTMVDAARWLGEHGGIDTLVVALGANNALPAAVRLRLAWSDHPDQSPTVSTPTDFATELAALSQHVATINARRVIWATVPHVTVAPIAHGIGGKPPGQRYFEHYIHPWIDERDFLPGVNPSLTAHQAWAIDAAIDQYNYSIKQMVYRARIGLPARDWLILDLCGLLDRLAFRRYINDSASQPAWWGRKRYQLPQALAALIPTPDTQFFLADSSGRTQGGLIALDGVHPTTIGYAILADEVLKTIDHATGRRPLREIDFTRYIDADTLITHPPSSLAGDLRPLARINTILDIAETLLGQPRS